MGMESILIGIIVFLWCMVGTCKCVNIILANPQLSTPVRIFIMVLSFMGGAMFIITDTLDAMIEGLCLNDDNGEGGLGV